MDSSEEEDDIASMNDRRSVYSAFPLRVTGSTASTNSHHIQRKAILASISYDNDGQCE